MSGVYIWINIGDDEHDHKSLAIVYMKIVFDIKTKTSLAVTFTGKLQHFWLIFDWRLVVNLTDWLVQFWLDWIIQQFS